jgi:tape measure domain-containing protein
MFEKVVLGVSLDLAPFEKGLAKLIKKPIPLQINDSALNKIFGGDRSIDVILKPIDSALQYALESRDISVRLVVDDSRLKNSTDNRDVYVNLKVGQNELEERIHDRDLTVNLKVNSDEIGSRLTEQDLRVNLQVNKSQLEEATKDQDVKINLLVNENDSVEKTLRDRTINVNVDAKLTDGALKQVLGDDGTTIKLRGRDDGLSDTLSKITTDIPVTFDSSDAFDDLQKYADGVSISIPYKFEDKKEATEAGGVEERQAERKEEDEQTLKELKGVLKQIESTIKSSKSGTKTKQTTGEDRYQKALEGTAKAERIAGETAEGLVKSFDTAISYLEGKFNLSQTNLETIDEDGYKKKDRNSVTSESARLASNPGQVRTGNKTFTKLANDVEDLVRDSLESINERVFNYSSSILNPKASNARGVHDRSKKGSEISVAADIGSRLSQPGQTLRTDLRTLIHEIVHGIQTEFEDAGKEYNYITTPENDIERGFAKKVRTRYKESDYEKEIDAHIRAERMVDDFASALGISFLSAGDAAVVLEQNIEQLQTQIDKWQKEGNTKLAGLFQEQVDRMQTEVGNGTLLRDKKVSEEDFNAFELNEALEKAAIQDIKNLSFESIFDDFVDAFKTASQKIKDVREGKRGEEVTGYVAPNSVNNSTTEAVNSVVNVVEVEDEKPLSDEEFKASKALFEQDLKQSLILFELEAEREAKQRKEMVAWLKQEQDLKIKSEKEFQKLTQDIEKKASKYENDALKAREQDQKNELSSLDASQKKRYQAIIDDEKAQEKAAKAAYHRLKKEQELKDNKEATNSQQTTEKNTKQANKYENKALNAGIKAIEEDARLAQGLVRGIDALETKLTNESKKQEEKNLKYLADLEESLNKKDHTQTLSAEKQLQKLRERRLTLELKQADSEQKAKYKAIYAEDQAAEKAAKAKYNLLKKQQDLREKNEQKQENELKKENEISDKQAKKFEARAFNKDIKELDEDSLLSENLVKGIEDLESKIIKQLKNEEEQALKYLNNLEESLIKKEQNLKLDAEKKLSRLQEKQHAAELKRIDAEQKAKYKALISEESAADKAAKKEYERLKKVQELREKRAEQDDQSKSKKDDNFKATGLKLENNQINQGLQEIAEEVRLREAFIRDVNALDYKLIQQRQAEEERGIRELANLEEQLNRQELAQIKAAKKEKEKQESESLKRADAEIARKYGDYKKEAASNGLNDASSEVDENQVKANQKARSLSLKYFNDSVEASLPEISEYVDSLTDLAERFGELVDITGDSQKAFDMIKTPVAFVTSLQVLIQLGKVMFPVIDGLAQMEKAMSANPNSNFAKSLTKVKTLAVESGADINELAKSFKAFQLSTEGTKLESQSDAIFESVSRYGTAVGANSDEMGRAFLALQQIAAKGKVSLEELNGQLSEALPGASNKAAEGLGMTKGELIKAVAAGEVMADDLLPALTQELNRTTRAMEGLSATPLSQSFGKLKNEAILGLIEPFSALYDIVSIFVDKVASSDGMIADFASGSLQLLLSTVVVGLAMATKGLISFISTSMVATTVVRGAMSAIGSAILPILALSAAIQVAIDAYKALKSESSEVVDVKVIRDNNKRLESLNDTLEALKTSLKSINNTPVDINSTPLEKTMQGLKEEWEEMPWYKKAGTKVGLEAEYRVSNFLDPEKRGKINPAKSGETLYVENALDAAEESRKKQVKLTEELVLSYQEVLSLSGEINGKELQGYAYAKAKAKQLEDEVKFYEVVKASILSIKDSEIDPTKQAVKIKAAILDIQKDFPGIKLSLDLTSVNTATTLFDVETNLKDLTAQSSELGEVLSALSIEDLEGQILALKTSIKEAKQQGKEYSEQEQLLNQLLGTHKQISQVLEKETLEANKLTDALNSASEGREGSKQRSEISEKLAQVNLYNKALTEGQFDVNTLSNENRKIQMATSARRLKDLKNELKIEQDLSKLIKVDSIRAIKDITGNRNITDAQGKLDISALTDDDMGKLLNPVNEDKLGSSLLKYLSETAQTQTEIRTSILDEMQSLNEAQFEVRSEFAQADEELLDAGKDLKDRTASAIGTLDDAFNSTISTLSDTISQLERSIEDTKLSITKLNKEAEATNKKTNLKRSLGVNSGDLFSGLIDLVNQAMDVEAEGILNELDLSAEAIEIQREFDDGIKGIKGAFDSYLNSFREFQKELIAIQAEQAKIAQERADLKAKETNLASFDPLKAGFDLNDSRDLNALVDDKINKSSFTGYKQGIESFKVNKEYGESAKKQNAEQTAKLEKGNINTAETVQGIDDLKAEMSNLDIIADFPEATNLLSVSVQIRDTALALLDAVVKADGFSRSRGNPTLNGEGDGSPMYTFKKEGVMSRDAFISLQENRLLDAGKNRDSAISQQKKAMEGYKSAITSEDRSDAIDDFASANQAIAKFEMAIDAARGELTRFIKIEGESARANSAVKEQIGEDFKVITNKYGFMATESSGAADNRNLQNDGYKNTTQRTKTENAALQKYIKIGDKFEKAAENDNTRKKHYLNINGDFVLDFEAKRQGLLEQAETKLGTSNVATNGIDSRVTSKVEETTKKQDELKSTQLDQLEARRNVNTANQNSKIVDIDLDAEKERVNLQKEYLTISEEAQNLIKQTGTLSGELSEKESLSNELKQKKLEIETLLGNSKETEAILESQIAVSSGKNKEELQKTLGVAKDVTANLGLQVEQLAIATAIQEDLVVKEQQRLDNLKKSKDLLEATLKPQQLDIENRLNDKYVDQDEKNKLIVQSEKNKIALETPGAIEEETQRLIELGKSFEVAKLEATATIDALNEKRLGSLIEQLDTVQNKMKDVTGELVKGLFSLDFSDESKSFSEKVYGLLDSIAKDIQNYAAEKLSGFVLDAIFKEDETKTTKEIAKGAASGVQSQVQSYADQKFSEVDSLNSVDQEAAKKRGEGIKSAASTVMGYVGAAAAIGASVKSGKTGSIIGSIIGGVAGAFLGGGSGAMLGSGLGGSIGGMFAEGSDDISSMFKKEKNKSGNKAMLAVVNAGESILSDQGRYSDAALYRSLKKDGIWQEMKMTGQFYGGTDKIGSNSSSISPLSKVLNSNNKTNSVVNNWNIKLTDKELVPRTKQSLEDQKRNLFG